VSTPYGNRKRRFARADAQTLLLALAVILSALALYVALREERRPTPPPAIDFSDGVSPPEAEIILQRASDATNFVSSLLNFLEVAFSAISLALVVGAWVLRGMILDQVEETREFVKRTEEQLQQRNERLDQLEKRLTDDLRRMVDETHREIDQVKRQGRDSFRVLSLQLLAEQQVRAHNIETAIGTLQTALALAPDDHATNYLLGYLHASRQEIDQAIEYLEHALAQEPNFTPGIAALGLALRRQGDRITDPARLAERDQYWAQAESKLLEALSKDSKLTDADGESYYGTLGGLYRRQKRYYAALDAYERAHRVTPDSSYPVINLATIHKHQGNDTQAEHYFQEVVKQAQLQLDDDPRDAWTRCDLAEARLVLGEPEVALAELQIVIDQEPERGVLEAVRSGLQFLAEAPEPIPGLDQMIAMLDKALPARDEQDKARAPGQPDQKRDDQAQA
jgi:tetratricopeptide (TPR) repeat protein